MMIMLTDTALTLPQNILLPLSCCYLIHIRRQKLFVFLYAAITLSLHIVPLYVLQTPLPLKTFIILAVHYVLLFIFSQESFFKTLLFSTFQFMILVIPEAVSTLVCVAMGVPVSQETLHSNLQVLVLIKLVYLLSYILFLLLFCLLWLRFTKQGRDFGVRFPIVALPIMQMVLIGQVGIIQYHISASPLLLALLSIGNLLLSAGSVLLLFRELQKLKNHHLLEQRQTQMESQLEIQENYYRQLEETIQKVRTIRHDMNNQLQTVYALIRQGDASLAERQIFQVAEQIRQAGIQRFCENHVVDAVLEEKAAICQAREIPLQVRLDIPEDIRIDPVSLCSLFANTLDNAIRASMGLPKEQRSVTCTGKLQKGYLTLRVENTYNPSTDGKTEDGKMHSGLGLSILSNLADAHSGKMEIQQEDDRFSITVWMRERE